MVRYDRCAFSTINSGVSMNTYRTPGLSIFFGSAQQAFVPALYKGFSVLGKVPFNTLIRPLGLRQLVFLHQTHGTQGKFITNVDACHNLPSFVHDGDFLITNVPHIGIAVATADCLPIIAYDSKHKVIGIAHAGWRGSVARIVQIFIQRMYSTYETQPEDLEVFFGPSAKACCYEVKEDFAENISSFVYKGQLLQQREQKLFFELGLLNKLQLEEIGVKSINESHHMCTICTPGYCSVRLTPASSERQMTIVALN